MADGVQGEQGSLLPAEDVAQRVALKVAANGIQYALYGDLTTETGASAADLLRFVQAVPAVVAPTLAGRGFYFVPLTMAAVRGGADVLVAPAYTTALAEGAICHRTAHVPAHADVPAHEGIFISARLLRDPFGLAFEFLINVAHLFAESNGVPDAFQTLAWKQATSDVRGETSQDAWEFRAEALPGAGAKAAGSPASSEKARAAYLEAAFSDALAIYMLSLALDFDYAELREREYPLLAPGALAERLRLMAELFPPNDDYTFSIRYRRR